MSVGNSGDVSVTGASFTRSKATEVRREARARSEMNSLREAEPRMGLPLSAARRRCECVVEPWRFDSGRQFHRLRGSEGVAALALTAQASRDTSEPCMLTLSAERRCFACVAERRPALGDRRHLYRLRIWRGGCIGHCPDSATWPASDGCALCTGWRRFAGRCGCRRRLGDSCHV